MPEDFGNDISPSTAVVGAKAPRGGSLAGDLGDLMMAYAQDAERRQREAEQMAMEQAKVDLMGRQVEVQERAQDQAEDEFGWRQTRAVVEDEHFDASLEVQQTLADAQKGIADAQQRVQQRTDEGINDFSEYLGKYWLPMQGFSQERIANTGPQMRIDLWEKYNERLMEQMKGSAMTRSAVATGLGQLIQGASAGLDSAERTFAAALNERNRIREEARTFDPLMQITLEDGTVKPYRLLSAQERDWFLSQQKIEVPREIEELYQSALAHLNKSRAMLGFAQDAAATLVGQSFPGLTIPEPGKTVPKPGGDQGGVDGHGTDTPPPGGGGAAGPAAGAGAGGGAPANYEWDSVYYPAGAAASGIRQYPMSRGVPTQNMVDLEDPAFVQFTEGVRGLAVTDPAQLFDMWQKAYQNKEVNPEGHVRLGIAMTKLGIMPSQLQAQVQQGIEAAGSTVELSDFQQRLQRGETPEQISMQETYGSWMTQFRTSPLGRVLGRGYQADPNRRAPVEMIGDWLKKMAEPTTGEKVALEIWDNLVSEAYADGASNAVGVDSLYAAAKQAMERGVSRDVLLRNSKIPDEDLSFLRAKLPNRVPRMRYPGG